MKTITLTINKTNVYGEVKKTSEYTGTKMEGDEAAYDRIRTTDDDTIVLDRFFNEAKAEVAQRLKGLLSGLTDSTATLEVSSSFDDTLTPAMQSDLDAFFAQRVTALWFVFTNKKEANDYSDRATALLEEVRSMAFHKKKPTRPTYTRPATPPGFRPIPQGPEEDEE